MIQVARQAPFFRNDRCLSCGNRSVFSARELTTGAAATTLVDVRARRALEVVLLGVGLCPMCLRWEQMMGRWTQAGLPAEIAGARTQQNTAAGDMGTRAAHMPGCWFPQNQMTGGEWQQPATRQCATCPRMRLRERIEGSGEKRDLLKGLPESVRTWNQQRAHQPRSPHSTATSRPVSTSPPHVAQMKRRGTASGLRVENWFRSCFGTITAAN
jgi:hypothetical protein